MQPKKARQKKKVGSCVELKFRAPHSSTQRCLCLTHWLISTQVKQLKKLRGKGAARQKSEIVAKGVDLGNKMSKARQRSVAAATRAVCEITEGELAA